MRVNVGTLDPKSPLAIRIRDALSREVRADGQNLAPESDLALGSASYSHRGETCASGQISGLGGDTAAAPVWPSEEALHRAIVGMIAAHAKPGVIAFHVPNGGKRGKAEAGRLKGMGTVAGIPDLIILANGRAYGLEIKAAKGRMSPGQKTMARRFADAGIPFEIARSLSGARNHLRRWGVVE